MKRLTLMMFAGIALVAITSHAADSSKMTGWISDKMCAAKHTGTGMECVKKCIAGGSPPVFVDDAKKEVWSIDNPQSIKDFYGAHISISATENAEKKSVHIDSAVATK